MNSNEYTHLQQQIRALETQVNSVIMRVSEMSRPPVSRATHAVIDGPINTAETGRRIPMAFSDPEMQRAYDAGERFKTPDERRIEELERALAGMLFEFDDGVNGGHRESHDERVAALDYARTLVKAEEFKA